MGSGNHNPNVSGRYKICIQWQSILTSHTIPNFISFIRYFRTGVRLVFPWVLIFVLTLLSIRRQIFFYLLSPCSWAQSLCMRLRDASQRNYKACLWMSAWNCQRGNSFFKVNRFSYIISIHNGKEHYLIFRIKYGKLEIIREIYAGSVCVSVVVNILLSSISTK